MFNLLSTNFCNLDFFSDEKYIKTQHQQQPTLHNKMDLDLDSASEYEYSSSSSDILENFLLDVNIQVSIEVQEEPEQAPATPVGDNEEEEELVTEEIDHVAATSAEVNEQRKEVVVYDEACSSAYVRQKEVRRHYETPPGTKSKTKKGPVGVKYQPNQQLRIKTRNRRHEGLKFKIKELCATSGDLTYLEFYHENPDKSPDLSTKKVYSTSKELIHPRNQLQPVASSLADTTSTPVNADSSSLSDLLCMSSPSGSENKTKSPTQQKQMCCL